jgi:hypothetical protein
MSLPRNDSLVSAMLNRRSRRFGRGMHLQGGPLEFESQQDARPLSLDEEAALAFAATGITGFVSGELPYRPGPQPESGAGHMMTRFWGRTIPSADGLHTVSLMVTNDEGCWYVKRPQNFAVGELPEIIQLGRQQRWTELYEQTRVKIADGRVDVPRAVPFHPSFNLWDCNEPGTTIFLPVNEVTEIYLTVLFASLNEQAACMFVDDRNGLVPAGLAPFGKRYGGWLHDDPADGRTMTLTELESWLLELPAIEQGAMVQNLGLMTQALGLGGFPHYAAHPYKWFEALGFRMGQVPLPQFPGGSGLVKKLVQRPAAEILVDVGLGLEVDGQTLIKPYCPPYYANMREAVLAFVDYKFHQQTGIYHGGEQTSGWRNAKQIQSEIPGYSQQNIEAVIAYCEYLWETYGRFPLTSGPVRTIMAYQAHYIDKDFYRSFYRPEVIEDVEDMQ